jgi:hypothetical protein
MKLLTAVIKDLFILALILAIIFTYAVAADALLRMAGVPQ